VKAAFRLSEGEKVSQAVAPDQAKLLPGKRVEVESLDRRPADCGSTFDAQTIAAPAEVVPPDLQAGMEEVDFLT
jgi:hypothetical protein